MARNTAARREASEWFSRLGQRRVSTTDIHDFFAWRRRPANDAAYRAIERAWEMTRGRFQVHPDEMGFKVIDSRNGEIAQFANTTVAGVSEDDALDIVRILNRRALERKDTFGAH